MMVRQIKFAAAAAMSLLGTSFEAAPAMAGGFWENGCCGAVIVQPVPVSPSCSCGIANYGVGYSVGYGGGLEPGYPAVDDGGYGPGYSGGYRGGFYRRAAHVGYRGGLYRRAGYGGYRGLGRRGY